MKAFAIILGLLFCSSASAEFGFLKLNIELSMKGRKRVERELVVQESQTARINMAEPGEKKLIVELVPAIDRSRSSVVNVAAKLYAEKENGELQLLGTPTVGTKERRPASWNVQSLHTQPFDVRFTIESFEIGPIFSNEGEAIYHQRNQEG